jgi:hypothetical protein
MQMQGRIRFFAPKIYNAMTLIRALLVFTLFAIFPSFLRAQIEEADLIFRELKGLDGVWFQPTERGDRLEIWSIADDSTMIGRLVRIRLEDGDTVTLETRRLEWRGDTIQYIVTVRGQNKNEPIVYTLTSADFDGYLFENPAYDDPQKIRYQLLGNRELQVNTEGKRGNRTVKDEYVFEREFTPGAVEFRARLGANMFTLNQTGNFLEKPRFTPRAGWEIGTVLGFRGNGGYLTLNVDIGLLGKRIGAQTDTFALIEQTPTGGDTVITYFRDVTYGQNWLSLGVYPELTFKRGGRLSVFAGPYIARLLFNRTGGTELPGGENKLFDANNDFKKTDIGLLGGLNCKLNFGKKDVEGKIGIRAGMGLANIDNLYNRGCTNAAFCNGQITLTGISVSYSMNLLKL